jgi:plastocyanin domain-containing protein
VGGDVDNVIELSALSAGTYRHNCSMGMYAGRISVIQPPTGELKRRLGLVGIEGPLPLF